jgi:protein phosphatase
VPTIATIAGLTDAGERRTLNEDTFRVSEVVGPLARGPEDVVARLEVPVGLVLGVYDGTGGLMRGEHPSETGARRVAEGLASGDILPGPSAIAERLVAAVTAASDALLERSRGPGAGGAGTTATVAVIAGEHLVVAHVGDSRAYRLRGRELVQITEDDTLLQHALRTGHLRPADAAGFPHKNVLLQVLGSPSVKVAVSSLDARRDDVILLSTDGIHGPLDDQAMRAVLLRHRAPGVAARVLLEEALRAGGGDNMAVVVARVEGGALAG